MRLLLNSCHLLCDEDALESLEGILHEKLNWNEVLQEAYYHGVAPILYHTLTKFQHNGQVPDKVLGSLQFVYKRTAYLNLNLFKALNAILEAFNENGLNLILIKGITLVDEVYGNIALRPMSDIDLLVRQEELDGVDTVLNELGYKWHPEREWLLQEYGALPYFHMKQGIVDIHWELFYPKMFLQSFSPLATTVLWENPKPISIDNHHALSLSNETHLLFLCLHMAKHFRKRVYLLWGCDIALFLQKYGKLIDWNYFWQLAKKSGQEKLIHEGLKFIEKYFRTEGEMLKCDDAEYKFTDFGSAKCKNESRLISKNILERMYNISGIWGKTKYLFSFFFPNNAFLTRKYGIMVKKRITLRRLYRPILLISRTLKEVCKQAYKQ